VSSKADINSPTFTGIPEAPTATAGTSTTQIATTAFVQNVAGGLGTMSTQNANAVAITGGAISGITDLAVADGGTGASTLAANNVLLGNGTSALQAVAPSTSGNFLRSNGTTWVSQAVTIGTGTVTSVATGNGLQGGTITSTGTLSVACPGFNTVGSYAFVGLTDPGTVSSGSNYAAGGGGTNIQSTYSYGSGTNNTNNLSGTWKWMGGNSNLGDAVSGIACRVS
jgi:hypothetical protein